MLMSFNPLATPIAREALNDLETRVYQEIEKLGHPYHNVAHTRDNVIPCVLEYARMAAVDHCDTQLLHLAALFHDFGHAGSNYRQLVNRIEDQDLSNEEHAAKKAKEFLSEYLSEEDLEKVCSMILATSYGQDHYDLLPLEHSAVLYRTYHPESKLEKLLALADISSFRNGIDSFMQDNFAILAETDLSAIPSDFDTLLRIRRKFVQHVRLRLEEASPYFQEAFATTLKVQLEALDNCLANMKTSQPDSYAGYEKEFSSVREKRLKTFQNVSG